MSVKLIKVTYCEGCQSCEFVKDSHVVSYDEVTEDMNFLMKYILESLKSKGHRAEINIKYNNYQIDSLESGEINAPLN